MTAEGNIYGVVNVRILPEFTGGCADSVVEKMTGNLEIAAEAVNGDPCGIQNLAVGDGFAVVGYKALYGDSDSQKLFLRDSVIFKKFMYVI